MFASTWLVPWTSRYSGGGVWWYAKKATPLWSWIEAALAENADVLALAGRRLASVSRKVVLAAAMRGDVDGEVWAGETGPRSGE